MDDIYGLIIILGLLLVIAQCANSERGLVESMVNVNLTENNNVNQNNNVNIRKHQNKHDNVKVQPNQNKHGNVKVQQPRPTNNKFINYAPSSLLKSYADANAPYGDKVAPSAQQAYALLKSQGKASEFDMLHKEITSGYASVEQMESQLPGFNSNAKGGLLQGQMGKHVRSAQDAANKLPRNNMNIGNNNIDPSNMNDNMGNASVNSNNNRNLQNANQLINSNMNGNMGNASVNSNNNRNLQNSNQLINSNSIAIPANSGSNNNNNKEINLHLIYTTWCGHSKRALPDFEKLMGEYDGQMMNGYKLNIKKHDADQDKSISKKYGVKGYPSYVMEKVENGQVGSPQPVNERSYDGLLNILKNSTV